MESGDNTAAALSEKEKKAQLKAQRKAEFEKKHKKELENKKSQDENKTQAQLKAERRAKQEAQRLAKAQGGNQSGKKNVSTTSAESKPAVKCEPAKKLDNQSSPLRSLQAVQSNRESPNRARKIFSHLPRRSHDLNSLPVENIPYPVVQVGYKFNRECIVWPTEKCLAMLTAFREVVQMYQPSPDKDLKRELQKVLFTDSLNFLAKCQPLSISMINAVKHLKLKFTELLSNDDNRTVKEAVCAMIDTFIDEEIICSREAINKLLLDKINENDIILTLGCSSIIKNVLHNASKKGKKFKVVVVDTRPRFEGRSMVQFLVKNNIPVTYILINSISYVMKEVTKVMIEGHSLLSNGYVMSHIGSSQIALVAKAYNVPVIVCCETYKFSDRVHTDCFVYNELGDSSTFFDSSEKGNPLKDGVESLPQLNILDLLYDLTPHEFVSAVITEKGMLPCTSVPVILRVRETK